MNRWVKQPSLHSEVGGGESTRSSLPFDRASGRILSLQSTLNLRFEACRWLLYLWHGMTVHTSQLDKHFLKPQNCAINFSKPDAIK